MLNNNKKLQFFPMLKIMAGLIAAATGELEAVLQGTCTRKMPRTCHLVNGNGTLKYHQNGATLHANGVPNGIYTNGNGLHL